nr:MAG TPA: hypothetical protein [Caudoviricetes sp.]
MVSVVTYASRIRHRSHLLSASRLIVYKCMAIFRYSYYE